MIWEQRSVYYQESDAGHRVSASRDAQGWLFIAWGPPDQPGLSYWRWAERACTTVTRAIGDPTPQRRKCLGVFQTADAARAACEADKVPQAEESGPGLSQHNAEKEREYDE